MILGIYGSGGHGREVAEMALEINAKHKRWDSFLFIDDVSDELMKNGIPIVCFNDLLEQVPAANIEIIVGVGEPDGRKSLAKKIKEHGYRLATVVHPDIWIPETADIGEGSMICVGGRISPNVKIGSNVLIQPLSCIGHDCVIGEGSVVSSNSSVAGRATVGEYSYIGMGTIVRERVSIGSHTIISMGSYVFKDIPDKMIATGNPARVVRRNDGTGVFG